MAECGLRCEIQSCNECMLACDERGEGAKRDELDREEAWAGLCVIAEWRVS